MRKFLVTVLLILVGLVVVAVALPFFLPREMIKTQLEGRVSAALGRELVVEGPLTFRPWRPFAFSLADVRLANPAWAENPDLARVALVDVEIDALAWLGGTIDVVRVVIDQPVLALEVDAEGMPSWRFEGPDESDDSSGDGDGEASDLPDVRIGDVALTDGAVTYIDHGTGERREFSGIGLGARTEAESGALLLDGAATSAGQQATLEGRIGDLAALLDGEPSSVNLELAAPGLGLVAGGEASPAGTAVLAVTVDMAPRTLLDWLGQPVALPEGRLESATFTVDLESAPDSLGLHALSLAVDELLVQGDLDLAFGERPRLAGRLDLGDLDLRPYLPAETPTDGAAAAAADAPAAEADGWSTEPLDLPLPLPLDLDLELVMNSLREARLETGPGRFLAQADAERASLEIAELALYGGGATGTAALTSDDPLKVEASLDATGVELLPVLQGAADIDYLEGTGNVRFTIEGLGDSVATLVESLAGDGEVLVRDGAILGINIAANIRQVMTLGVESAATQPQRTDFAEAGGTFTIERGIVRNDDFNLRAPVLRIEGAGEVALPPRTLDYRLTPHVASTLQGQDAGGEPDLRLGVPLVIEGAWASPAVRLDLGGALSGDITDPSELAETVARLAADPANLEALKEMFGGDLPGSLGDALEQLPGVLGGSSGNDDSEAGAPAKRLRDALGGLLGR